MQLQPYLFFEGRCEEAIEFYRATLGAEVTMLMRYKDSPEPEMIQAGTEEKVMHASLQIGDTCVMASDGHCAANPTFQGFALSISVADTTEAKRLFAALSDGGEVQMPLERTFWSPGFGMVADRFGVPWMINVVE